MASHADEQHCVQHNNLIKIVHPHMTREDNSKHDQSPSVESHQVYSFHQLLTLLTEVYTDAFREIVAILLVQVP